MFLTIDPIEHIATNGKTSKCIICGQKFLAEQIENHIVEECHREEKIRKQNQELLAQMDFHFPPRYYASLSQFLRKSVIQKYFVEHPVVEVCDNIRKKCIELGFVDVSLEVFGSAAFNATTKDSAIDIHFTPLPDAPKCGEKLLELCKIFKGSWKFSNKCFVINLKVNNAPVRFIRCIDKDMRMAISKDVELSNIISRWVTDYPNLVDLIRLVRQWGKKVELFRRDPYSMPGYAFDVLAIHYFQETIHFPFKNATDEEEKAKIRRQAFEEWNLGYRWIDFWRFMNTHGTCKLYRITLTEFDTHPINLTRYTFAPFAIMNPVTKRNFVKTIEPLRLQAYLYNAIITTFLSFVIPRDHRSPLVHVLLRESMNGGKTPRATQEQRNRFFMAHPPIDNVTCQPVYTHCEIMLKNDSVDLEEIRRKLNSCPDYRFKFTKEDMTMGRMSVCSYTKCKRDHELAVCILAHEPIYYHFKKSKNIIQLNNEILKCWEEKRLAPENIQEMKAVVDELNVVLQKEYREDAILIPIGSPFQGLGVKESDIDLVMKYLDTTDTSELNQEEEFDKIIICMKKARPDCTTAVVHASVPIIKFRYNDWPGDISWMNLLAIENTALLGEYCRWTPDQRFQILAVFIKQWARIVHVGDGSNGTMGSYAHTNMLIAYLQECYPPVLPRLQEDFRTPEDAPRMREGRDVYFHRAANQAEIEAWQKNKQTCAELLLGYFEYYSKFPFDSTVIQCRTKKTVARLETRWMTDIVIQDPFDLDHNVSPNVRGPKAKYIIEIFKISRVIFSKSPENIESMFKKWSHLVPPFPGHL